jgi:membrane-associated phospholipid phosphatase
MTLRQRRIAERMTILGAAVAYYLGGYFGLAWLTASRNQHTGLALPLEAHIPFVPAFSPLYSLVFPAILLGFFSIPVLSIRLFRRGALLFVANLTACFLVFLLFPVTIERPAAPMGGTWAEALAAFWFYLDPPRNLFPSLHVDLSVVSALVGWRHHRAIGVVTMSMAILVGISTLFLHQHYVVDVVAGAALAGGSYWALFVRRHAAATETPAPESAWVVEESRR